MKKLIIVFLLLAVTASLLMAATEQNTENRGGVAYGASGSARSTAYPSWYYETYIDTYNLLGINVIFRVESSAAETLIVNTLGANAKPDSLKSYYLMRADTLWVKNGASSNSIRNDSTFIITLPLNGNLTGALPRFLKFQFLICDSSGTNSTATISDSWIGK